jgi:hypothetical protein
VLAQRLQLGVQAALGGAALLVELGQLRIDPGELFADRRDELLHLVPALVEITAGLDLRGTQLGLGELGQLRHVRLQGLRAQRLERRGQALLGVGDGGQSLGGERFLMAEVGLGLEQCSVELLGAGRLGGERTQPAAQREQDDRGPEEDSDGKPDCGHQADHDGARRGRNGRFGCKNPCSRMTHAADIRARPDAERRRSA